MRNKNEIRKEILQRFINKSNQVINDIDKLTSHMYTAQQNLDEKISFTPMHSLPDYKN